jgi:hypothetical protein
LSFDPDDFTKFVDTQAELIIEANRQTVENAMAYHTEHCNDTSEVHNKDTCQDTFMRLFIRTLQQRTERIMQKIEMEAVIEKQIKERLN